MNMFTSSGPAGVGAAFAAFAVVDALLRRLEVSKVLSSEQVNEILTAALAQVPEDYSNRAREDAHRLISSLKR